MLPLNGVQKVWLFAVAVTVNTGGVSLTRVVCKEDAHPVVWLVASKVYVPSIMLDWILLMPSLPSKSIG